MARGQFDAQSHQLVVRGSKWRHRGDQPFVGSRFEDSREGASEVIAGASAHQKLHAFGAALLILLWFAITGEDLLILTDQEGLEKGAFLRPNCGDSALTTGDEVPPGGCIRLDRRFLDVVEKLEAAAAIGEVVGASVRCRCQFFVIIVVAVFDFWAGQGPLSWR